MEQSKDQTSLCRAGCGFYGNDASDGMCSKCHKDSVKRKQQTTPTPSLVEPTPSPETSTSRSMSDALNTASTAVSTGTPTVNVSTANPSVSVSTALPTASAPIPMAGGKASFSHLDGAMARSAPVPSRLEEDMACSVGSVNSPQGSPGGDKRQKRRCSTCKKKVGLTGFQCRCGGLFCPTHRYSDRHECPFDYQEHGQEQIRQSNPVIKGQKITKI